MRFQFNFLKSLQTAAVLLAYEKDRRMSCIRLLKLLYIADRESMAETGWPITGDKPVAMKHGPVLSQVYDLLRGQASRAGEWDGFAHVDGYKVELVTDPGRGKLSRGEVARLLEVSGRYRDMDDWALVEETHTFQEWVKNFPGGNGAADIPWEDTLAAVGRSEWKAAIEQEEADHQSFDIVFSET
jgi:uncharacterized phage-associated protein